MAGQTSRPTPIPPDSYPPSTMASLQHTDSSHAHQVLEVIASLRTRNDLCDVVLVVADREIVAHRLVLAASSPYFQAMFTGELSESRQSRVTLRDVSPDAVERLVDFAYTAKVDVNEENVQSLLSVARLLQLQSVVDICCEFLADQLDATNCLGISHFAERYNCPDLKKKADRFALRHFDQVAESDEFLALSADHLAHLLASDELDTKSEEIVWNVALRWIKHDETTRRRDVAVVMEHVRFSLLTPAFLVGTVSGERLVRADDVCRDLVDEAKNFHLMGPDYSPRIKTVVGRERVSVRRDQVMYAVGGWCSGDAVNTVEKYNPMTDVWTVVAPMTKQRCGVGVAVLSPSEDLDGDLYAVGGHDGVSYLNSVERYDSKVNAWFADVPATSACRTSVGVAVLDGLIYAVGGQDGVSCLNIVERYNPTLQKWDRIQPMNARRLGVAVTIMSNRLYAVGGSDGTSPLSSVEQYEQQLNQWTPAPVMTTRRKHLGVAALENCLYAVGGRDELSELNTVERFDPRTGHWSPIASMLSRRSGVGLGVVNGKLYAVGGFDGTSYLNSVEWLDLKANAWRTAASMNFRRLGGGVGVMKESSVSSGGGGGGGVIKESSVSGKR